MVDTWMCLRCGDQFPAGDYSACPGCGGHGVPANLADTVSVDITWHELRVLVMWAEQHASRNADAHPEMLLVVRGIADRLQRQHLERLPLTLTGELAQLRSQFPNVEVHGFNEIPPDAGDG